MILTTEELRDKWGAERYLNAVGAVSGWFEGHPVSKEQLEVLQEISQDAFDWFGSWTYHSSKTAAQSTTPR